MDLSQLVRYYHTLKYVKAKQLYYQVYYRIKKRFFKRTYSTPLVNKHHEIHWETEILFANSYWENNKFSFLNIAHTFSAINWNFSAYGKLWTYNLNYFDFLNQKDISKEQGLLLIQDYMAKHDTLKDGLEPYPISLRGINWIKFLSKHGVKDAAINIVLYQHYLRLADNLEYHLLGNHLLENGFSLLFGAYYFKDETLYSAARKILKEELEEQILEDGTHFELSPMYHQIILHRVLDCVNLLQNNKWKQDDLLPFITRKATKMLSWLKAISFNNNSIPMINDAADGIAPDTTSLVAYASQLQIKPTTIKPGASGYRKFEQHDFELLMDVGAVGPSYQPGHAHADTLQFLLNYKNQPIVVDTGTSTYEKNERRNLERSTCSHNTVTVNNENSSEVWGGFRVAKRAQVTILEDTEEYIEASHNGYQKMGVSHSRSCKKIQGGFEITDHIEQKNKITQPAVGHLHFHPDTSVELSENMLIINNALKFEFSSVLNLKKETYQFAEGFNKLKPAVKVTYLFGREKVSMTIQQIN